MRHLGVRPSTFVLLAGTVLLGKTAAAQAAASADTASCFAQPRAPRDTAARADTGAAARARRPAAAPDIVLFASVSARELRFQSQPRVRVRLCGGLDSVRVVERENLPRPVVAGVTYRDVRVSVEILGHIYADCLRDALAGGGRGVALCPTASPDTQRSTPRRPQ